MQTVYYQARLSKVGSGERLPNGFLDSTELHPDGILKSLENVGTGLSRQMSFEINSPQPCMSQTSPEEPYSTSSRFQRPNNKTLSPKVQNHRKGLGFRATGPQISVAPFFNEKTPSPDHQHSQCDTIMTLFQDTGVIQE